MHIILEKISQFCGAYYLIKLLHSLLQKIAVQINGNLITQLLYGAMNRYVFRRHKPLLTIVKLKAPAEKNLHKSGYITPKLLRRDVRNNVLLFKFMHLRKYDIY